MTLQPIPKNLTAARSQLRLAVEEVAEHTKISADRLEAFEAGEIAPSRRQIERLAEIYNVDFEAFFDDNYSFSLLELIDFRSSHPKAAKISPSGLKPIWYAEKTARATLQLRELLDVETQSHFVKTNGADLSLIAASQQRTAFDDWRTNIRRRLPKDGDFNNEFLLHFRIYLESQGIIVQTNAAPAKDYIGFCKIFENNTSVLFINRSTISKKAQLFTLTHEFAHVLLGQSGTSDPFSLRNDVERSCNRFAANFLAPLDNFIEIVKKQPRSIREDVFALVSQVSEKTLLSKYATAVRLVETESISRAQLHAWETVWKTRRSVRTESDSNELVEASFAPPHARMVNQIGFLPLYLAKLAQEQKYIDSYDIASSFGLNLRLQDAALALAERRMEAALFQ